MECIRAALEDININTVSTSNIVSTEFKTLTFTVTGKLRTVIKAIKKNRKLFAAGDNNGSDLLIWVGVDDDDGEDYWLFIDLKPFYKVYDDNDNDNDKNYVKNDNNDDDGH